MSGTKRIRSRFCSRAPVWAVAALCAVHGVSAFASSHREAPFISGHPKVDATDFYMFRSYEAGREGFVTIVANYLPLQDSYGGPNYFSLDPNALYEIHIDNNGDAKEDLTFQFRFKNTLQGGTGIALNVGGKTVAIPLTQAGGISAVNGATQNVRETFSVDVVRGDRRSGQRSAITNATGGAAVFDKPVDNIGDKTFGGVSGYAAYAAKHMYSIKIPGCQDGRMFVGQRKDPFQVPLGKVFDLINLNPLGPEAGGNTDKLDDKNVTSMILEVPIACVATATEPVIGGWTTASLRQARLLDPTPKAGHANNSANGGAWVQVSRLGMPLVNEVVIGLKDKDRFNASKPKDDGQFADYVTNPTLPALVELLFPSAPAPTNFPRTDLVAAFLTGLKLKDGTVVNQPKNVVASEMLRLNTAIAPTARGAQKNLGVAAGDLAGFPNGRRPGDDVVDVALRVSMGALCALTGVNDTLGVGCKPSDAPAGAAAITDGVKTDDSQFDGAFPYIRTPLPGSPN
jgi:Domain of unknown function (DUF4331)